MELCGFLSVGYDRGCVGYCSGDVHMTLFVFHLQMVIYSYFLLVVCLYHDGCHCHSLIIGESKFKLQIEIQNQIQILYFHRVMAITQVCRQLLMSNILN